MKVFWSIIGMIASAYLLKYRERVGEMLGEPEWMHYVGGVYNFVAFMAIFFFFWSVASLTNTERLLFYPIFFLIPQMGQTVNPI